MNFSVAPMMYGATNSLTVEQNGTEIKYASTDAFQAVVEAMEETYVDPEA